MDDNQGNFSSALAGTGALRNPRAKGVEGFVDLIYADSIFY